MDSMADDGTIQGIVRIDKGYIADENGVLSMITEAADPQKLKIVAYTDYSNYDATGKAVGQKTWDGSAETKDGVCVFTVTIPCGSQGITVDKLIISSTEPMQYGQIFQGGIENITVNYEKEVALGKTLTMNDRYIVPKTVSLSPAEKDLDEMMSGSYDMELYGWAYAAVEETDVKNKEITRFFWGKKAAATRLFVILTNDKDQVIRTTIEPTDIKSDGQYAVTFKLPKQPAWDVTASAKIKIKIQALPYRINNFEHWYYNSQKDKWYTQDDLIVEYAFKEITDALDANDGYKGQHELAELWMGENSGEMAFYSVAYGLNNPDVDYNSDGERIYWNNDGSVWNLCIRSTEYDDTDQYNPKGNDEDEEPSNEK